MKEYPAVSSRQISDLNSSDYRVLDLTDEKGHLCGKILADLGFDVIKIEPPHGDPARNKVPFFHDMVDPEKSLSWFTYNSGKRGITLDIEHPEGKSIFKKLVGSAGLVIESFDPGYMKSLDLDYKVIRDINQRVIMTSISWFGQSGPQADYLGSDLVAMAEGGLMYGCGYPDRAPVRFSAEQSLSIGSAQAAAGTMISYYHRQSTGHGQYVDSSIQASVTSSAWLIPQMAYLNQIIYNRMGTKFNRRGSTPTAVWPCKDGHVSWMVFTGEFGRRTATLVRWMDEYQMAGDLNEVNWVDMDMNDVTPEQLSQWESIFAKFFLLHTRERLYLEAVERGFVLFSVATFDTLRDDVQLKSRDYWLEIEHPDLGETITYPGAPCKISSVAWSVKRPAPHLGEHNTEIFGGELGMSENELLALKKGSVI